MTTYRVGVDIGGTFTDAVAVTANGVLFAGKSRTTPHDLADGFFASIADAAHEAGLTLEQLLGATTHLSHGTTVGINAMVSGTGAATALFATRGHGDSVLIMNGLGRTLGASIEELLDYERSSVPAPVVPERLIFEIPERIDFSGEVVIPIDLSKIDAAADRAVELGVEAVAVAFLWSFVNPQHEIAAAERIRAKHPLLFVSCSHEVAPRIGEYARTVSTVINASLGPLMDRYVAAIGERASAHGYTGSVAFAQVEGGVIDAAEAQRFPILTIQSGPVAGVVGTASVASDVGHPNVVLTDMGGTTLDVATIVGGEVAYANDATVARHLAYLRNVDVSSVGAGGGSIAWIDPESNTLRVGPQSAGASPGPICYGRGGTAATVTDADLVLGVLNAESVFAGGTRLDLGSAERALDELGKALGLDRYECAAGIVEIVDSRMEDMIRRLTLQRGHDPRDFTMWAFGGASGAHAGLYAQGIGVSEVVFPLGRMASVWSAFGLTTLAPTRTFQLSTYFATPFDVPEVTAALATLERQADEYVLSRSLDGCARVRVARMKYPLQVNEVEVVVPDGDHDEQWADALVEAFHASYERTFGIGSGYRGAGAVISAVQVTVVASPTAMALARHPLVAAAAPVAATRPVYWRELGGFVPTAVLLGDVLHPGHTVDGPAVIEFDSTTIAVRPKQTALVDEFGNVRLRLGGA